MKNIMNIARMDFISVCCDSDGKPVKGTERSVCILFNINTISTEEVYGLVDSGMYEYDERIIVTTPKQADNLRGVKKYESYE